MKLFVALVLGVSSLSASVISVDFNGVLNSTGNTDTYGYFGSAGSSLNSAAFSLAIAYDPAASCTYGSGSNFDLLQPCAAGSVSESLTINGTTLTETSTVANSSYVEGYAFEPDAGENLYQVDGASYSFDSSLISPTVWAAGQINVAGPSSVNTLYGNEVSVGLPDFSSADHLFFNTASQTVAGTPEPSTALLLAGSLATGLILFRSRRAA